MLIQFSAKKCIVKSGGSTPRFSKVGGQDTPDPPVGDAPGNTQMGAANECLTTKREAEDDHLLSEQVPHTILMSFFSIGIRSIKIFDNEQSNQVFGLALIGVV